MDLERVPNDRMLEVLCAQYRQLAHEQARTAATIAEIGRCAEASVAGTVVRLSAPHRFAPEETRAALRFTGAAAYAEHEFSEAVVHAMPLVFGAWSAGEIDRQRVRVFHRYLGGLAPELIARVCAVAVPRAPQLTTGQLEVLLRRLVIAADPDAAARWYRAGLRERGVTAYPAPDGTVVMTAAGLPVDEAAAACERIHDLATAVKRAGHPGRIGQIRCDLFLGLLDGRFHGMTTADIVAAVLKGAAASSEGSQSTASDSPAADSAAADSPAEGAGSSASPERDDRRGIEIRVALSTLMGRDEHPAEIPGLGPLVAPAARVRVTLQRRAQWRFAVTDADGHLLSEGVTRRRPASGRGVRGPVGGVVELHVPQALLEELAADPSICGEWAGLVADIARQHARRADHLRDLDAHPGERVPRPALRRHTEIRDRTCVHPCCRRRAGSCQQDHTQNHARGGATVRANLGPVCPHDHDLKTVGGWHLEQPEPGRFLWRSPLGGAYPSRGEFLDPPVPRVEPSAATATDIDDKTDGSPSDDDPIFERPGAPRDQQRGPPGTASDPVSDLDEPPPF